MGCMRVAFSSTKNAAALEAPLRQKIRLADIDSMTALQS